MRFKCNHACQKVKPILIQVLRVLRERDPLPSGERGLEVRQLQRCGPVSLIRSALNLEYLENLVYFRISRKESLSLRHLCEDTPYRPYVYRC